MSKNVLVNLLEKETTEVFHPVTLWTGRAGRGTDAQPALVLLGLLAKRPELALRYLCHPANTRQNVTKFCPKLANIQLNVEQFVAN